MVSNGKAKAPYLFILLKKEKENGKSNILYSKRVGQY